MGRYRIRAPYPDEEFVAGMRRTDRLLIIAALAAATLVSALAIASYLSSANAAPRSRAEIVAHPAGCPRVLFCGCGVCLKAFGHPCRRGGYAQARTWRRLPRTSPHRGAVAVFGSYHVAYVEDANSNAVLLYDPNSGGGLTRLHWVSFKRVSFFVQP